MSEQEEEMATGEQEEEMEEARPQQHMEETLPPPLPDPSLPSQRAHDGPVITGAPGGPLFMPGFISPFIRVRNFQGSCVTVLMALQGELNDASIQCADDADILVDDLKIITEEQLVNYALKGIPEEKVSGATKDASESSGKKASSPDPIHGSDSHAVDQNTEMLTEKKGKRKPGRPYDRDTRGAVWIKDEKALSEESIYLSLRVEREAARRSCTLRSLRLKDQQKAPIIRLDCCKRLQALNFLVDPLKVDPMAIVSGASHIEDFEVILWIEIGKRSKQQKAQSFLVLGSQMLTMLRDKIYCLSDRLMKKANSYTPSGYFHIENFYYNDLRDPAATDYSAPILSWMHDQQAAGRLHRSAAYAADMATTQFLDLQFRVGKHYVYCHQGGCKHAVVVKDMRLIHKEDIQNSLLYPLLRSPFRIRQRKCSICDIYAATKVTFDDKMAPQSPCLFCDYCYYVQHYSQEGTLVYGDFKVYDYYHD